MHSSQVGKANTTCTLRQSALELFQLVLCYPTCLNRDLTSLVWHCCYWWSRRGDHRISLLQLQSHNFISSQVLLLLLLLQELLLLPLSLQLSERGTSSPSL